MFMTMFMMVIFALAFVIGIMIENEFSEEKAVCTPKPGADEICMQAIIDDLFGEEYYGILDPRFNNDKRLVFKVYDPHGDEVSSFNLKWNELFAMMS